MQPQLFTKELFEATFVQSRTNTKDNWPDWVKMMREKWDNHKNVVFADHVTMLIEFNVDGVAPFKAARKSGQFTPILGRLTGLRGDSGTFTLFGTQPFIVGYWFGLCEPPTRILNDLARELRDLHPSKKFSSSAAIDVIADLNASSDDCASSPPCSPAACARPSAIDPYEEPMECVTDGDDEGDDETAHDGRRRGRLETADSDMDDTNDLLEKKPSEPAKPEFTSVGVEVDRFACDAPATSKLTGRVGHSGYYSQPRCREKGEKLLTGYNEKGRPVYGPIVFPNVDCHRKKRHDHLYYTKYMEAESDAEKLVS